MLLCLVSAARYRPNLSIEDKTGAFSLTTPSGEEHQFAKIVMWRGGRRALLLNKEIAGAERYRGKSA